MQPFFNENLKKPNFKLKMLMVGATLVGIFGIVIPVESVVATTTINPNGNTLPKPTVPALENITNKQSLTVATIANQTTYFAHNDFEHGFGFDVLRGYAEHLGVTLRPMIFDNEAEVLEAVKSGNVDIALTTIHQQTASDNTLNHVMLNCGQDFLQKHGLNEQISLQMPIANTDLSDSLNNYLCNHQVLKTHKQLASFHTQYTFKDDYSKQHFTKTMKQALPLYRASFKQNANKHKLDWELLVAMGYQESHLDAEAVSPTGVKGLMMLTNDTAEEMGITDRENPVQSIQGGAKYLQRLEKQFSNVPDVDRVWFIIASYNMGPQAVKNIQEKLNKKGKNGNSWAEVYRYLAENQHTNSRYTQCLDYVTNIRGYLEVIKLDTLNLQKRDNSPQKAI